MNIIGKGQKLEKLKFKKEETMEQARDMITDEESVIWKNSIVGRGSWCFNFSMLCSETFS